MSSCRSGFITVGRAFTARLARRSAFAAPRLRRDKNAAPYVSYETADGGEGGFTLIETMISTLVLTIGMIAIAGMLAVATQMQIGAREAARSTRLAQDKIDELMKLDFDTAPEIALVPGGNLAANVANYSETPLDGITLRWLVAPGPTGLNTDTRVLTVRVINLRAQQYRQTDIATIIREW